MTALALVMRRRMRAAPEVVFAAWTDAEALRQWWGPEGVLCAAAELDVRVGGRFRIGNSMPNGTTVWIAGVFERVDPPNELAFTWRVDDGPEERVSVRLTAVGADETEVVIVHEKIADDASRASHSLGWDGCLGGLERYLTS